jgi:hypothetical protein
MSPLHPERAFAAFGQMWRGLARGVVGRGWRALLGKSQLPQLIGAEDGGFFRSMEAEPSEPSEPFAPRRGAQRSSAAAAKRTRLPVPDSDPGSRVWPGWECPAFPRSLWESDRPGHGPVAGPMASANIGTIRAGARRPRLRAFPFAPPRLRVNQPLAPARLTAFASPPPSARARRTLSNPENDRS